MNTKWIILVVFGLAILGLVWWVSQSSFSPEIGRLMNEDVARIKSTGVLRVGVDATYAPMEFIDENKEIVGLDPDLAEEIAKEFGVTLVLKNFSFDNLFVELGSGGIDMIISSVTITEERSKTMSFSKPYFNAGQVIVAKKTDNSIIGVASLTGKKIGVQAGTTSEIEANRYTVGEDVLALSDYDNATVKLLSGEIDVMIMDYPAAVGKVSKNPDLKIVGQPFTQEFYGVVVAKGKEGLLVPVNKVISSLIDSGGVKVLENKWVK